MTRSVPGWNVDAPNAKTPDLGDRLNGSKTSSINLTESTSTISILDVTTSVPSKD